MKFEVEAGTDAASLLLFDPEALPDDFDDTMRNDPMAVIERLGSEGSLRWIDPASDGAYLLHAYVDEPIPESLRPYAVEPALTERFSVPSGRLYFTGLEYGFKHDDSYLKKYPHMGQSFEVPPGTYRLTFFNTDYPDGLHESLLRERVSPWAFRLHESVGYLMAVAVLSVLIALIGLFIFPFHFWLTVLFPVGLAVVASALLLSRVPLVRKTAQTSKQIEWEYPSFIALLERREGSKSLASCDQKPLP